MPLPEKVVEQLGKETSSTPGWSTGLISFSAGILFITIFLWAGLQYGYKPYFDAQTQNIEKQISAENSQISPGDQTNLIDFYSQLSNLKQLLNTHEVPTNLLTWLQANTEQNVYFSSFTFTGGDTVTLIANARTEPDANQQIAILENSPEVQTINVSGITPPTSGAFWQFSVTMTIDSSIIASSTPSAS